MTYDPLSNQSTATRSRQRRRSEDAAVEALRNARLGFNEDDMVTAIRRVRSAERPLVEARTVIRMAGLAKAQRADADVDADIEVEPMADAAADAAAEAADLAYIEEDRRRMAAYDATGKFDEAD